MRPFNEQFTLRGMIIGVIGCVIITASSVYVALKLGALPWPIFFVVLLALFSLKLLGNSNINEANVSATVMSAGAMVAGGLAFTIPGIYMLFPDADVPLTTILLCAVCGVGLGLICTALVRKHFIEEADLPFPIGQGAAETLQASEKGGHRAALLFSSMGIAGVFALLRDYFGAIPAMLFDKVSIPGVNFGVYCSPMALAMGFMIGPTAALVWFVGALLGNFGIVVGGTATGLWDLALALDIRMSLGIGVMIGCGVGIIIKVVIPHAKNLLGPMFTRSKGDAIVPMRWAPFLIAAIVLVLAFAVGLGILPSLLLVLLTWIVVTMAAQCTGQAGLNPMEVFGVIVLLIITIVCNVGGIEAFLIAAVATVACGFVGDLMNDFKAGHLLKSDPKALWFGEALGGIVGAFVATGIIGVLIAAYGSDSFGIDREFVAAQATAVASMVGGIPHLPAFIIGVLAGTVLYLVGAPVITLGLGIYLPFYLSLTVAIGAAVRFIIERAVPRWATNDSGIVVASGLLGGESIVGVIIALIAVISGITVL